MTSPGYFYDLGFLCAYHSLKTLALEKFLLSKFLYQCYLLEDFPDSSQLMFFFFFLLNFFCVLKIIGKQ